MSVMVVLDGATHRPANPEVWTAALNVLAFPLLSVLEPYNPLNFNVTVLLNSAVWGAVLSQLIYYVLGRTATRAVG